MSKTIAYTPHLECPIVVGGVKMTSEPVKYLGTFLAKQDKAEHLNFEAALVKMCRIGSRWRKRSLTLRAQVLILICMIFSIFTHVLNTVSMSAKQLEMI